MYLIYDKSTGLINYSVEENTIDVIVSEDEMIFETDKKINIDEYYIENNSLKRKKDIKMYFVDNTIKLSCDLVIGEIKIKIINNNQIINVLNLNILNLKEDIIIEKNDNDKYLIILEGDKIISKEITV
jgi:hypothetical protein